MATDFVISYHSKHGVDSVDGLATTIPLSACPGVHIDAEKFVRDNPHIAKIPCTRVLGARFDQEPVGALGDGRVYVAYTYRKATPDPIDDVLDMLGFPR